MNWLGRAPHPRIADGDATARRPVVAVFDSSVGEHPWLGRDHVLRDPEVLGTVIGLPPDSPDAEASGTTEGLVGELGEDAGHGTFIAGLIRQACPDALILAVRLFQSDGVVDESDLLRALQLLCPASACSASTALPATNRSTSSRCRSATTTSSRRTRRSTPLLHGPLALLGRLGVCVVVSAGNDATSRPAYPAAFAPYGGGSVPDDERSGAGLGGRRAQPGRLDRDVQQRRPLGALPPARRRAGQHVPDRPTTRPRRQQPAAARRAGSAGASIDPDDYLGRLRRLERYVVLRTRLRRPGGRASPAGFEAGDAEHGPGRRRGPRPTGAGRPAGSGRRRDRHPARGRDRWSTRRRTRSRPTAPATGQRSTSSSRLLTPLLWHTVRGQGVDPVAAEDVVQTIWMRLLHSTDVDPRPADGREVAAHRRPPRGLAGGEAVPGGPARTPRRCSGRRARSSPRSRCSARSCPTRWSSATTGSASCGSTCRRCPTGAAS